ncbi:hypothetical protein F5J12DRAFT_783758 [Pisolithus orientalis]|uniref:uncharacterized protein n=1 Tax=Pisolithus orientalis TaxID=936130 RepID=UPI002224F389|nr:uncharacterized protein F5J12DRAFT_783758 [Pisolithus orientalis]KAI6002583.1 hypothetical protein F5J12DRAFT_783758 [Pisolithus orientalis]
MSEGIMSTVRMCIKVNSRVHSSPGLFSSFVTHGHTGLKADGYTTISMCISGTCNGNGALQPSSQTTMLPQQSAAEVMTLVNMHANNCMRDKSVAMFVSSGYSAQMIMIPIPLEGGDSKLSRLLRFSPNKAIHAKIHPILSEKCIAMLLSLTGEIVKSDLLMGLRA